MTEIAPNSDTCLTNPTPTMADTGLSIAEFGKVRQSHVMPCKNLLASGSVSNAFRFASVVGAPPRERLPSRGRLWTHRRSRCQGGANRGQPRDLRPGPPSRRQVHSTLARVD